jgi:proteasome lid subunit RPN8/RPN11
MPPSISFTSESWHTLMQLAEKAYPNEGCGLLVGPLSKEKVVQKVVSLHNVLLDEGRGRFDFSFNPKEFMDQQLAAEREGLDVVGIFHTHPDHPPRPSATDAAQPMLSGWINIIAAVNGGKFKEAKAWWRDDEQQPFHETELVIPR